MILVDSSGWIEVLADGPLADQFAPALQNPEEVLVPAIVVYEVVRRVYGVAGDAGADQALALLNGCHVVTLDAAIASRAARLARERGFHMADALIAATAETSGEIPILTKDPHFIGFPGATVVQEKGRGPWPG